MEMEKGKERYVGRGKEGEKKKKEVKENAKIRVRKKGEQGTERQARERKMTGKRWEKNRSGIKRKLHGTERKTKQKDKYDDADDGVLKYQSLCV